MVDRIDLVTLSPETIGADYTVWIIISILLNGGIYSIVPGLFLNDTSSHRNMIEEKEQQPKQLIKNKGKHTVASF